MIYFSHLLSDSQMRDIIRQTHMGVESIEFSISDNLDNLSQTLLAYEKRLDYMECEHLTLHGPFLDLNPMAYDSEIRKVTLRRYNEAYTAAKKLNAKKIIFHSCYLPQIYMTIGLAERIADFYHEFLDDKDTSIEILAENVFDSSPESLVQAAKLISHPAFGLCLDIGHANCWSDFSPIQWVNDMTPFIRHVHLHNNDGKSDSHKALDCGSIPAEHLLKQLDTTLPDAKTYTIECRTYEDVIRSWSLCQRILTKNISFK